MQQGYLRGARLRQGDGYDPAAYPYCLPAVQHIEEMALDAPVTLLVGENGTGKSTLLEGLAVAWGLNPEGGSRNFTFSTRATHSPLYGALTLIRGPIRPRNSFFLRAESITTWPRRWTTWRRWTRACWRPMAAVRCMNRVMARAFCRS